jgi:DNA-binding PadR family transcriptional regulator
MRLSEVQKRAIRVGSPTRWLGHREIGVPGDTMTALERRGLAEVKTQDRRMVYRLTEAGNALRVDWAIDSLWQPSDHTPVATWCPECGDHQPDSTPGGRCACGGEVIRKLEDGQRVQLRHGRHGVVRDHPEPLRVVVESMGRTADYRPDEIEAV